MITPTAPRQHRRTIVITNSKPFPFGGAFFTGTCVGEDRYKGKSVQVVATYHVLPKESRVPIPGDICEVEGWYQPNPYDRSLPQQLHAHTCKFLKPEGRLVFYFLRHNEAFKGLYIGAAKWNRIENHFGSNPESLISSLEDGDIRPFLDNNLLSAQLAGRLIEAWRRVDRDEIELVSYLQEKGFETRLATKLIKLWGPQCKEYLEENPYYLVALQKWDTVDDVARKLYGIAKDDPRRLIGAVLTSLNSRLLEGKHTLTQHATLIVLLERYLGNNPDAQFESAIELAIEKGVVVGDKDRGYQLDGAGLMERRVRERIEAIYGDNVQRQQQISFIEITGDFIDKVIVASEHEQGFDFNKEQKQAIRMALTNRASVICGGAGCGKTAVIRAVLEGERLSGKSFYQMAVSGRAAKRITESTGSEAYTIARFQYLSSNDRLYLGGDPLIIIDEASMLDLSSIDRILRQLQGGARLLFVGDEAQLPPVSFGLVFHKIVESDLIPRTRLIKVERSSDESGIADIAREVREGKIPQLKPFNGTAAPGVSFIRCKDDEIDSLVARLYANLRDEENTQIISIRNDEKPGGVIKINRMMQDMLDERFTKAHGEYRGTYTPNRYEFWERYSGGDKVMYLKNDPELDLNNGTLGVVEAASEGGIVIKFEGVSSRVEFVLEDLNRLTLAYAITTHKAQGSQFRRVIIPIVRSPKLLDRALVYTALTRGMEQVVFVGNYDAFCDAVAGHVGCDKREVGFHI